MGADAVAWINGVARRIPVWAVYVVYLAPVPVLLWMAQTGGLGREPISALEHELGEIALQLLIIGLAISPLRRVFGLNLLRFRRAIGLLAFTYVVLHLLVWAVLDVQSLSRIWADILKRPYITIGMAAMLLMVPLALTSNDWSVRRLGAVWRQLHRLVYAAALLGGVHYVMLSKGLQLKPLLYLAAIIGVIAMRFVPGSRRESVQRQG